MVSALDATISDQLSNGIQQVMMAACIEMPAIIGAAPEVIAAAKAKISALRRAAGQIESSMKLVDSLTEGVINGPVLFSRQEAKECMELFASVDNMVVGQAAYIRLQLRREIMPDPSLGEMKQDLIQAYETAASALDHAHKTYLLLMSHTRQFMPVLAYRDSHFAPSKADLEHLADASVAMLHCAKDGEDIEFV